MRFLEILEHSKAMEGDWGDNISDLGTMSEFITNTKWELLKTFEFEGEHFEFRKLRNSLHFMLGYFHKIEKETKSGKITINGFKIITKMELSRVKAADLMGYKKTINVDGIKTLKDYRGLGIATILYKYLVNDLGYTILGDKHQYFGARKLWAKLSNELDVIVDLIDIESKKIIDKNIILHHGNYDGDFDTRLWSYKDDKLNIRSILTRIN